MKKTLLMLAACAAIAIASGCTTAQAVPKSTFGFNPKTGEVSISSPKDSELNNVTVAIVETNGMKGVQISIGSYKTSNNADVIEKSGAGTALMYQAAGQMGAQMFAAGLQAAAKAAPIPGK